MRLFETPSAEEIAGLRARLPRAFAPAPRTRLVRWAAISGTFALFVYSLVLFDASPARLATGIARLGDVLGFMFPPHIWTSWERFMEPMIALGETLAMAFLGTLLASLAAFPLGFLGARTVMRFEPARFATRRLLDILRAFEQLVLALIFIRAFGLGPLAGIFAIAVSDTGVLAKLFAESIENIDQKPLEGVRSTGASRLQVLRLALLPQVWPVMLSNILYYLESNTRSATILGIVGAGGIGYMLYDRISINNWGEVMSIIILILITVYAMDTASARLRLRLIGGRATRAAGNAA